MVTPDYAALHTEPQRAAWLAARARNASYRWRLIALVAGAVAVGSAFVLLIVPREAERALRTRLDALPPPIDTTLLIGAFDRLGSSVQSATGRMESARAQRQRDSMFAVSVRDVSGVSRLLVGDTTRARLAERLQVARSTRLVDGYLALAADEALTADPVVQTIADSLRVAEQERTAIAALGTPDQRYRALQDRVQQLGDRLDSVVTRTLYSESSATLEAAPAPVADSSQRIEQRALRELTDSLDVITASLRRASAWNAERAAQEQSLRAAEPLRVPVLPMLAATLVLALSLGYVAALIVEWRQPSIAGRADVLTIVARARMDSAVVTEIRASPRALQRRTSDQLVPRVLQDRSTAYNQVYQQISAMAESVSRIGVLSDDPMSAARLALQIGAAAAQASREVLLVDGDVLARPLASVIEKPDAAGLADVARERLELAGALTTVPTGRDRSLSALTAGITTSASEALERIEPDLQRLMDRHDLTVVVLPATAGRWPETLIPADLVLAATAGATSVGWLRSALAQSRRAGRQVRSVMVRERRVS